MKYFAIALETPKAKPKTIASIISIKRHSFIKFFHYKIIYIFIQLYHLFLYVSSNIIYNRKKLVSNTSHNLIFSYTLYFYLDQYYKTINSPSLQICHCLPSLIMYASPYKVDFPSAIII